MNIKITYSWLLEYLDTDVDPYEIQKYLSLCGPSVETVNKVGDDYVFDIEITSNRVDMASVFGVAQEASAILPQFGKKANLKFNPLTEYTFDKINTKYANKYSLKVTLKDKELCSRFSALVFENIKIKPSPEKISKRLTLCGIRSINSVVDISNYLMLSLGQPVHVFDFDQIKKSTMIMRKSNKGEKIVTLDEKEVTLPGNDIIIEDGEGRLIDLCGLMGAANSAVSTKTKNVLLFVQTYNKDFIRKSTMTTGQRTEAATLFEKGLDPERVEPTLAYGTELLEEFAEGKVASQLINIYPEPYQEKKVDLDYESFKKIIGIDISKEEVNKILSGLGFKIYNNEIGVPSWRQFDINIKEDLVEEVARIYGYNILPNKLQPVVYLKQPEEIEKLFKIQLRIKYLLKHLGLNEVLNYSMISKSTIFENNLGIEDHLRLSNSISEDIEYLRNSLVPSLVKNVKDNTRKKDVIKLFEIAKVYLPRKNDLPEEPYKLGIVTNTDYLDLKGIVESILKELNIINYTFEKATDKYFSLKVNLLIDNQNAGYLVKKDSVFIAELNLKDLINAYRSFPKYRPLNPYAVIKLDKTFALTDNLTYDVIQRSARQSKLLQKIEVVTLFKNKLTLRFYYSALNRNITEEEAKEELI